MKIRVVEHYSNEDKDFSMDCEQTEVFIYGHPDYEDGHQIDLPFEENYPSRMTDAFVNGMIFCYPGEVEVETEKVNDEDW